jgi:hypothetical protein
LSAVRILLSAREAMQRNGAFLLYVPFRLPCFQKECWSLAAALNMICKFISVCRPNFPYKIIRPAA